MPNCTSCGSKKIEKGLTHCNVCAHVALFRVQRSLDGIEKVALQHQQEEGNINNALSGLVLSMVAQVRNALGGSND